MKKLFLLSFVCIMAISLIAGASDLTNNPKLELAKLTQGPNWISAAKSLPTEKKADEANKVTAITGPALNLYPILDHKVPEGSLPTYIRPSTPVRLASDMETVILSEGFEADTLIPAGWTDNPGTSRWRYNGGTSGSPNPGSAHTGNYAAFFNVYGYTSGTIDTLISPSMDLSTYSGNYALSFWGWDGVDPYNYVDSAYFILCENGVNTTYLGRLPITDTWTQTTFQFSSNSTAA